MKLVDVMGLHFEVTTGSPVVVLREHEAPHRVLPVFVGANEAMAIGLALSGQQPPRPLTHDLMAAIVTNLDAQLDAVELTEMRDGAFLAQLALDGPTGAHRVDTRPSDGIALALRLGAPLYVDDEVLDEAGSLLTEEGDGEALDEAEIDAEVADFASFLEHLDPADFEADFEAGDETPPTD